MHKTMMDIRAEYASTPEDWSRFLQCWRQNVNLRLSKMPGSSGFGAIPAEVNLVEEQPALAPIADAIERIEARLQVHLPKSYVHFVTATRGRGWFVEAFGRKGSDGRALGGALPVAAIGPFAELEPVTYRAWMETAKDSRTVGPDEYYRYGYQADWEKRQDSASFNLDALRHLIKVGELDQGAVVLLNPKEQTQDGEMEAWTLSFQSHARRFRSFAELMQDLAYVDADPDRAESVFSTPAIYARVPCIGMLQTAAMTK